MTANLKFITFKDYAGFVARIAPAQPFSAPTQPELHISRAVWLTGQCEAAAFGTVQGYDGCGMSGGILHHIAVMPKDKSQGSFFNLLNRIIGSVPASNANLAAVVGSLAAKGWVVSDDGKLRVKATGALVPGEDIRKEFSGPKGVTPSSGPQHANARAWATRFCHLFGDPATFRAQSSYAASWLAGGNNAAELAVYNRYKLGTSPALDSTAGIPTAALPPELDLAMSVYHSFSTNAPSVATKILAEVYASTANAQDFSKKLIRALGKKQYGRWADEPGERGGNRYDRTRQSAKKIWPLPLINAYMPADL